MTKTEFSAFQSVPVLWNFPMQKELSVFYIYTHKNGFSCLRSIHSDCWSVFQAVVTVPVTFFETFHLPSYWTSLIYLNLPEFNSSAKVFSHVIKQDKKGKKKSTPCNSTKEVSNTKSFCPDMTRPHRREHSQKRHQILHHLSEEPQIRHHLSLPNSTEKGSGLSRSEVREGKTWSDYIHLFEVLQS